MHRLGVTSINQEKIAQKLHFHKLEDFLAAIGHGDVPQRRIVHAIQEEIPAKAVETAKPFVAKPATQGAATTGVLIEGVGNLMVNVAKCCKPVPPDPIAGYVTRDRGITIHRQDCSFMRGLAESRLDRMLGAQWGHSKDATFAVEVEVDSHDRQGLLRDIGDLFAREKVNVTRVDSLSENNQAKMRFTIEIAHMEQLTRLLALIHQVPSVIAARRRL